MTICKLREAKGRRVQYLDAKGKWKSTGCWTMEEATLWYHNKYLKSGITLAEFATDFYFNKSKGSYYDLCMKLNKYQNKEWWMSNTGRLERYIMPHFGNMRLDEISAPIIQDWYINLEGVRGELASATKKKVLNCLSTIMKYAVFKGIIDKNPCDNVIKITEHNEERLPFSRAELKEMFPDDIFELIGLWGSLEMACFLLVMRDTGWRPGEIAGLDYSGYFPEIKGVYTTHSLDFKTKKIKDRVKTSDKGYKYRIGLLSDQTVRMLDELKRRARNKKGLIFLSSRGEPFSLRWIEKSFKRGLISLNISTENRPVYALRTTFFTIQANELDKEVLMELMGHRKWHTCYDKRSPEDVLLKLNERIK